MATGSCLLTVKDGCYYHAKFIYYYFIVVNQLYHLKIILTANINFVLQDIVERKSCASETSSSVTNDRFLLLYQLSR